MIFPIFDVNSISETWTVSKPRAQFASAFTIDFPYQPYGKQSSAFSRDEIWQKPQVSILAETYPNGHLICDIYKKQAVRFSSWKKKYFHLHFAQKNDHLYLKFFWALI